jgi:hypothetical protein
MCLGATTRDASLGHLDHLASGRLKANYFNVVPTVVARAWYSGTTRVPAGVRGCSGSFASDIPRSSSLAHYRHEMSNIYIAATAGFSFLVRVSEIEYESKKEMCFMLQIFIVAGQPCAIAADLGRYWCVAADAPAVVQRTAFAQRLRSRRVSSPHASGHCESASVAASPGKRRQNRTQPFKMPPASRAKAGNATVIGRTSSRRMAPDRENSVPCCTHRHGMRFRHRYASITFVLLNESLGQPADASAAAGRSDRPVPSVGHWWRGWQLAEDARQAGSHSVAG